MINRLLTVMDHAGFSVLGFLLFVVLTTSQVDLADLLG